MRTLAVVLAIAASAAYAANSLFVMRTAWSVTLAILAAAGGVIAIAVVLRNAPKPPARRRRGAMPDDPGIPKPPQGAPYRGPH
jgi:hypothetical protein